MVSQYDRDPTVPRKGTYFGCSADSVTNASEFSGEFKLRFVNVFVFNYDGTDHELSGILPPRSSHCRRIWLYQLSLSLIISPRCVLSLQEMDADNSKEMSSVVTLMTTDVPRSERQPAPPHVPDGGLWAWLAVVGGQVSD